MGLSVEDLEAIEHHIVGTIDWLDENCDAELDELENKEMELDDICRQFKLNLVLKNHRL
ncbi:heat shock protein 70 family [Artemisia annua]|uniref:Heat shock protein 70 family n=1 Tax=Artemisia annua TaxID=35608 RepID=A0A2U1P0P5_ARTAN|nr:heat shock protein 70 family [Artemisia annua]